MTVEAGGEVSGPAFPRLATYTAPPCGQDASSGAGAKLQSATPTPHLLVVLGVELQASGEKDHGLVVETILSKAGTQLWGEVRVGSSDGAILRRDR